ncbi:MAG: NADH-quinone oxidoreductase subunit NuoE [Planctomycetes bacterium]|nr:NADH-quinone oxidoreductase subunit NuoE [Planctomycetota bacterium]
MSTNVSSTACLDTEPLDKILTSIPNAGPNDLVPILQEVQKAYGYLPKSILMDVSDRTGIPASRIYGVATFYEQFYLEPRGRHTIKCCRGTACHVRGGPDIIKAIEQALGIGPNETTEDMLYTFETVACLGTCFLAPVIMVNNDYYGHLSAGKIKSILKKYA